MSSSENKEDSKAEISQVEDEWYYCSDTSDTDTYYSEEEDILCGFVKDTDSPSDSDREISDGDTKFQLPVTHIDFHEVKQEFGKPHITQKDTLQIYPESHRKHLQDHNPEILKRLDALHKEGATVAYVSPSVAEDLHSNSTSSLRDVVCDVCIFNPQKPVKILTFTSRDELSSKLMRHNSKAARAFRGVDVAPMMQKENSPKTLSKNASHTFPYLEEDQGCGPKPDLECDGHSDDDIEETNGVYNSIPDHVESDTDFPNESDTNLFSEQHNPASFDVQQDLIPPSYPRSQDHNNNKIMDARSRKKMNGIVKFENNKFHLFPNQTDSKQHTLFCNGRPYYEGNPANGISPVERTNQVSSDATHVYNGQTELCLKGSIPQNVSVTKENLQLVNRHSDDETSQFLDVDHDVLRDISVVSAALIEDEWKNPNAFLEKVEGLETLAREVELPESLEMDRERYVRVLKSFFSRLSAAHMITHDSSPT